MVQRTATALAHAALPADSPLGNLYDAAGLPVGPFEIEVQW
jgi:hypothetical protein